MAGRRVLHGRGLRHQAEDRRRRGRHGHDRRRHPDAGRRLASTRRTRSSPGSRTPPGTPRRASTSRSAGASATTSRSRRSSPTAPWSADSTQFDDVESSESPFTFSFAPRFEIGKSASVYGRVATGFRPGGPNVLPPGAPADVPRTYDSDRLTSYELGLKAGGGPADKFSLDLSAFYLDWEDIQLFLVVNDFGINGNGGTAVSKGLELAASLYPTSGLTLSANGAYTKSEAHRGHRSDRGRRGRRSAAVRAGVELRPERRLRVDGQGQHARLCRRQPGLHGRPNGRLRQPDVRRQHPPGRRLHDPEPARGRLPRPLVGRGLRKEPDERAGHHGHQRAGPASERRDRPRARSGPGPIGVSVATRFWGS